MLISRFDFTWILHVNAPETTYTSTTYASALIAIAFLPASYLFSMSASNPPGRLCPGLFRSGDLDRVALCLATSATVV